MWWLLFFFEAILMVCVLICGVVVAITTRTVEYLLLQNRELREHVGYLRQVIDGYAESHSPQMEHESREHQEHHASQYQY